MLLIPFYFLASVLGQEWLAAERYSLSRGKCKELTNMVSVNMVGWVDTLLTDGMNKAKKIVSEGNKLLGPVNIRVQIIRWEKYTVTGNMHKEILELARKNPDGYGNFLFAAGLMQENLHDGRVLFLGDMNFLRRNDALSTRLQTYPIPYSARTFAHEILHTVGGVHTCKLRGKSGGIMCDGSRIWKIDDSNKCNIQLAIANTLAKATPDYKYLTIGNDSSIAPAPAPAPVPAPAPEPESSTEDDEEEMPATDDDEEEMPATDDDEEEMPATDGSFCEEKFDRIGENVENKNMCPEKHGVRLNTTCKGETCNIATCCEGESLSAIAVLPVALIPLFLALILTFLFVHHRRRRSKPVSGGISASSTNLSCSDSQSTTSNERCPSGLAMHETECTKPNGCCSDMQRQCDRTAVNVDREIDDDIESIWSSTAPVQIMRYESYGTDKGDEPRFTIERSNSVEEYIERTDATRTPTFSKSMSNLQPIAESVPR